MPAEATARLRQLSLEHDEALRKGNLVRAAQLAVLLRDGTQKALNASDIDDTLGWFPPDTESLLVWDERQRLRSTDTQASLVSRGSEYFARTRLLALDNGGVYRKLAGRTIRLVVIGIGKIEAIAYGDDSKFKLDSDFSGLYFFEDPVAEVTFGSVDTPIDHVAVWRSSIGKESNWIARPRPDLLVVCTRRETLVKILRGAIGGRPNAADVDSSRLRAFPQHSRIWGYVDRTAPFWAFRVFANPATVIRDDTNPRAFAAHRDERAVGVTMGLRPSTGELKLHYLTDGGEPSFLLNETMQLRANRVGDGIWSYELNTFRLEDRHFPVGAFWTMFGIGGHE